MQLVSPMPGSIAGARTQLVLAQGVAADLSNAPQAATAEQIEGGIAAARRAAAELFLAEPRSPYQDLVAARQHVLEGQQLLERAWSSFHSAHGVDPAPQVKLHAGQAFGAFERAFEILDND